MVAKSLASLTLGLTERIHPDRLDGSQRVSLRRLPASPVRSAGRFKCFDPLNGDFQVL